LDGQYPHYRVRHCLHDDLQGLRKARVYREIDTRQSLTWLGRICLDAIRADFFSTLVWSDLKPTLKIYFNMLQRLLRSDNRASSGSANNQTVERLDTDHLAVPANSASGVFRQVESVSEK